jgi:hypothetical protein
MLLLSAMQEDHGSSDWMKGRDQGKLLDFAGGRFTTLGELAESQNPTSFA